MNLEYTLCNLQILEKSDILQKLEQEFKGIDSELKTFQSTLTTSEAEKRATELSEIVSRLETKLSQLSENKIFISKADRQKIEKQYDIASKAYRKRKRICLDILNSILENYPKSKSVLIEEIGMEIDDDNGIVDILKR